jgi:hypothetical protein
VEQSKTERFSNKNVDYYTPNPNCSYSWVESCSGNVVENAVVSSITNPHYIGLVFTANSLQIGKVIVGDRMYYAPNFSAVSYKVLVCNRKKKRKIYKFLLQKIILISHSAKPTPTTVKPKFHRKKCYAITSHGPTTQPPTTKALTTEASTTKAPNQGIRLPQTFYRTSIDVTVFQVAL